MQGKYAKKSKKFAHAKEEEGAGCTNSVDNQIRHRHDIAERERMGKTSQKHFFKTKSKNVVIFCSTTIGNVVEASGA